LLEKKTKKKNATTEEKGKEIEEISGGQRPDLRGKQGLTATRKKLTLRGPRGGEGTGKLVVGFAEFDTWKLQGGREGIAP